jgi:hypothetical protein
MYLHAGLGFVQHAPGHEHASQSRWSDSAVRIGKDRRVLDCVERKGSECGAGAGSSMATTRTAINRRMGYNSMTAGVWPEQLLARRQRLARRRDGKLGGQHGTRLAASASHRIRYCTPNIRRTKALHCCVAWTHGNTCAPAGPLLPPALSWHRQCGLRSLWSLPQVHHLAWFNSSVETMRDSHWPVTVFWARDNPYGQLSPLALESCSSSQGKPGFARGMTVHAGGVCLGVV